MDLTKLSDQDLLALKSGDYTKLSDEALLALKGDKSEDKEAPGVFKSGALGVMSGVPGAETLVSGIQAMSPDKTYAEAHKGLEEAKDAAWEAHPVAYGTGKGAGIIGTALAAPVTETLGGALAVGAGIGALSGADTAEAPSNIPLDAVKGAGTGAVLGAAGHGVGKVLESIPGISKSAVANLGSKTTKADIQSYLDNPSNIRNAFSKGQLGEKVADVASDIGTTASHLSGEARGLLNTENALSTKDLKNVAMETVEKYFTEGNAATAADETSIKSIIDQYQKLAQIAEGNGGKIPEPTVRAMIDRMQAATKESTFGNPEASASQTALKEFSGKLNDLLRKTNPTYAEGMAPSAEAAKLSGDIKSHFGLKPDIEGNLSPTNVTASKIGNVTNEAKPEGAALMERIKNATGQDLADMFSKSKTKENFDAPGAGGALKTLMASLGYGAGHATGLPFAGIGGAAVGRYAAEGMNGGNVAKNILDMYINMSSRPTSQAISGALQKYGPILVNAAKTGGNQLAATHFVLATSDPAYQTLVDHAQNNEGE